MYILSHVQCACVVYFNQIVSNISVRVHVVLEIAPIITVITSETTSAAAAGKVEICYHCLQVSNIVIHVCPTLQLTQAKP